MKRPFTTLSVLTLVLATCGIAQAGDLPVRLSGDQEVPAVLTKATGFGTITIDADQSVHGSIKTVGIAATMAHIQQAGPGGNGAPVIILTKTGADEWSIPSYTKLTDEQFTALHAGDLYINVLSEAHKSGEIRTQLKY